MPRFSGTDVAITGEQHSEETEDNRNTNASIERALSICTSRGAVKTGPCALAISALRVLVARAGPAQDQFLERSHVGARFL
jgi:hypothetical protein